MLRQYRLMLSPKGAGEQGSRGGQGGQESKKLKTYVPSAFCLLPSAFAMNIQRTTSKGFGKSHERGGAAVLAKAPGIILSFDRSSLS